MRTNQASGVRWTLAIVEPWLWSWPISWTGFVATSLMNLLWIKINWLWIKINWWPLRSSGIRRNWQQSNLSTLELCTLLPSRPMSACPSPHGDTLRDGKNDFDQYMKWEEFSTNNHASMLQSTLSKVWQNWGGHCAYQPLLANQQEPCHHSQVPCESTSWCPTVMKNWF